MPSETQPVCSIRNTKVAAGRLVGIPFFLFATLALGFLAYFQYHKMHSTLHACLFGFAAVVGLGMLHTCVTDIIFRADFFGTHIRVRRLFSARIYDYREMKKIRISAHQTTVQLIPVHDYLLMVIEFSDGKKHELSVNHQEVATLVQFAQESGFHDRLAWPGRPLTD